MIHEAFMRQGTAHIIGNRPGVSWCGLQNPQPDKTMVVSDPVFSNVPDPRCKQCLAAMNSAKIQRLEPVK